AIPRRPASDWLRPTRANSGSVNRQKGTRRPVVVRSMPARLSRTTRTSSSAMWVNWGPPAQSPTAHTPGAVVRHRSSPLTKPRLVAVDDAAAPPRAPGRPRVGAGGVRGPSARDQEVRALDRALRPVARHVQFPGPAGPPLHTLDADAGADLDPLVLEELAQGL